MYFFFKCPLTFFLHIFALTYFPKSDAQEQRLITFCNIKRREVATNRENTFYVIVQKNNNQTNKCYIFFGCFFLPFSKGDTRWSHFTRKQPSSSLISSPVDSFSGGDVWSSRKHFIQTKCAESRNFTFNIIQSLVPT